MSYTLEEKIQRIKKELLNSKETDTIKLIESVMRHDFVNMHGPEHHFLDGGALLVTIKNAGYDFDLAKALDELENRSYKMPGAMCGYWGICGSTASVGAVFSILDGTGPLSSDIHYADHMKFTASIINKMGDIGGPRCCKRNAFLSLTEGISYANKKYGLSLPLSKITCDFSPYNKQCLKERCPFYKDNNS